MNHSFFFVVVFFFFTLTTISSSIASAFFQGNKEPEPQQPELTPDEFKSVLNAREKSENEIVERARSKIGTFMKPASLINYCLNPKKDIDRFDLKDHAKMKDNELGLFVIDKAGSHIGIMSAGQTVIHAHPSKKYIVTEESLDEAKRSFPNGWRKIGPDGILKEKYAFKEQMDNIMKDVRKPNHGPVKKKTPPTASKVDKNNNKKKQEGEEGCPDCQQKDNNNKKKNGGGDL